MRVLVTGGAGYIGSHVCKAIHSVGFEPIVLDNLSLGHRQAVKWGPLAECDLADPDATSSVFRTYRPKAVIHLAASAYVGESMSNPRKYFENNIRNTMNLLGVMLEAGVKFFVLSSTCATYGIPNEVPILESHPQLPVNPYGESKLLIERMLHWYDAAYGFPYVALRYFNAAGADPQGELGEDHDPETHLLPLVIRAALGIESELHLFGTDYATADGTAVRDYTHVSDLAEAHSLALQYLLNGGRSTSINLGTGKGASVRDVIRAVERVCDRSVTVVPEARRKGDPPCLVADASKAREILGWTPTHSDLETIVRTAIRWQARRQ